MKTTSVTRIALMALALAIASPAAFAQTAPATTPSSPVTPIPAPKSHADAGLTADEKAHLKKVRTEALAANPNLKT